MSCSEWKGWMGGWSMVTCARDYMVVDVACYRQTAMPTVITSPGHTMTPKSSNLQ